MSIDVIICAASTVFWGSSASIQIGSARGRQPGDPDTGVHLVDLVDRDQYGGEGLELAGQTEPSRRRRPGDR